MSQRDRAETIQRVRMAALPGDAYFEGWLALQFGPPFFRPGRFDRDIGNLCGHAHKRCAENARQTAERRLYVECRTWLAAVYEPVNASAPGQQRNEGRLNFNENSSSPFFNQRGIANELEGIAQPLLRPQENR